MTSCNRLIVILSEFLHQIKDRLLKKTTLADEGRKDNTPSIDSPDKETKIKNRDRKDFDSIFNYLFYHLGRKIACYPSYFIIVPLFLTLVAITGFQYARYEDDFEKLWYPRGGPVPYERAVIENNFPHNYSTKFLPYHATRLDGFTRLLITAQDGGTVFRSSVFSDLVFLDKLIQNVTIGHSGRRLSYGHVCAKWHGHCFHNDVLRLEESMPEVESGEMKIDYPLMLFPLVVPMYFGGMEIDEENGYIVSAKAVSISYFLNMDTAEDRLLSLLWEDEFLQEVGMLHFGHINFAPLTSRSINQETSRNTDGLTVLLPFMVLIIVVYTLASVMTNDWVKSKPYIGLLGIVNAALGTLAAFGVLMYFDVPMAGINGVIPFLMLGIGLDDMFVVLSAWRRTSPVNCVVKRLADTYSEAGVSITITSLTNVVSFAIGMTTPVGAIRIFCLYTAVSIILVYIWHLTFFGGCIAVAGYLEKNQRHAFLCVKVLSKSEADEVSSKLYRRWLAGGLNPRDPYNPKDNKSPVVATFFRDVIGEILIKGTSRYILLCVFLLYMGGAIYGCTQSKEGLDREKVFRHDSYAAKYIRLEDNYFRKFPYTIQVAITGDLEYGTNKTRDRIIQLHNELESLPFIFKGLFTQSGIKTFYRYLQRHSNIAEGIKNETDFIQVLREKILRGERNRRSMDFVFDKNFTKIIACRFMLQSYEVNSTNDDRDMMLTLREIAKNYSDLNVTTFTPNYINFDQYGGIISAVLQATLIATAAMIVISLIFIPKPFCSVIVGISIISIEIGVIGYMSLWSVNMDPISTINLIMGIGFSVDFSAHVSYSYLSSKAETPKERMKDSLFCLGQPILQGGISTILCVVTLPFAPSYAYMAFFKVVVLVILCAMAHGLFFIPVVLAIFDRTGPITPSEQPPTIAQVIERRTVVPCISRVEQGTSLSIAVNCSATFAESNSGPHSCASVFSKGCASNGDKSNAIPYS